MLLYKVFKTYSMIFLVLRESHSKSKLLCPIKKRKMILKTITKNGGKDPNADYHFCFKLKSSNFQK